MSKGAKIAIVVAIAVVVILIVYYLFKGGSGVNASGNKYASGDSLTKAKSGNYGTYSDSPSQSDYNSFYGKAIAVDGSNYGGGTITGEIFSRAWFKGMNVALNGANFETFRTDIEKYVKDTNLRKPHWEITKGSFLTAA